MTAVSPDGEDGVVTLRATEPEAVLRTLWARGVPFDHLEVSRASLEEAFLSLTGGAHEEVRA